ncbi:MAG: aminoglycoside phosphotransferase, partial [Hyphomicrobium sp.]
MENAMPHRSASERPGAGAQDDDARREVIAWLGSAAAYPALSAGQRAEGVRRYETHGALVFAAGDDVYKIKRAVRFPYLDFSTLELRERVIRREFEINKPNAPELYLGVVAVTRGDDGQLQLGGCGTPVEWALHMRRFRDADLLSAVAARGGIDRALALRIADAVAAAHERAEVIEGQDGGAGLAQVLEQVIAGLAAERDALDAATVGRFGEVSRAALAGVTPLLDRRAAEGCVRRCHGDLHLGNIVPWGGAPLLFDALEFDDRLASVDTLYDVAFLLMD